MKVEIIFLQMVGKLWKTIVMSSLIIQPAGTGTTLPLARRCHWQGQHQHEYRDAVHYYGDHLPRDELEEGIQQSFQSICSSESSQLSAET